MTKHECEYLSSCCDTEVMYSMEIEFDESGAWGVCSDCHDYAIFYDEGHTPWDDDYYSKKSRGVYDVSNVIK